MAQEILLETRRLKIKYVIKLSSYNANKILSSRDNNVLKFAWKKYYQKNVIMSQCLHF